MHCVEFGAKIRGCRVEVRKELGVQGRGSERVGGTGSRFGKSWGYRVEAPGPRLRLGWRGGLCGCKVEGVWAQKPVVGFVSVRLRVRRS